MVIGTMCEHESGSRIGRDMASMKSLTNSSVEQLAQISCTTPRPSVENWIRSSCPQNAIPCAFSSLQEVVAGQVREQDSECDERRHLSAAPEISIAQSAMNDACGRGPPKTPGEQHWNDTDMSKMLNWARVPVKMPSIRNSRCSPEDMGA